MKELFSLGPLYPSDFLKTGEQPRCPPVEMKLIMLDNGLVRLEKTAPAEAMYGKYWYRSGINATMRNELKGIVDSIVSIYKLTFGDVWLDIACNDGTLLSFVTPEIVKIGIDPADNSFADQSRKHATAIVQDYFSADCYFKNDFIKLLMGKKAKVITSIAMFYDLEDPQAFIRDIDKVLHDDGLWVMQLSYTPLMLTQLAFDNICHEHIYYYTLEGISELLGKNGFRIMDVQLNDINGGSFRLYIMKEKADITKFGSQPYRDVCRMRFASLGTWELRTNYNSKEAWEEFFQKLQILKAQTRQFVLHARSEGKTIWGYGASTKGNTLLQYFGLDSTLIRGIADRNPDKWGLHTVGTNIPIFSEEEMRQAKPDYLLVLPWHFINEFKEREKLYLEGGGRFIVPCPKFEIVGT